MKTYTIVKFIESSNRFNMYIASFMSVCCWLFSHFTGKKSNFFTEYRFGVISILIFDFFRQKKEEVLSYVFALQSNKIQLNGCMFFF